MKSTLIGGKADVGRSEPVLSPPDTITLISISQTGAFFVLAVIAGGVTQYLLYPN